MVESVNKFECLLDPLKDRAVPTLETPPNKPIEAKVLFPYSGIYYFVFYSCYIIIILGADAEKPDWKVVK